MSAIPIKTPLGTDYILNPHKHSDIKLPIQVRRLLILVNGQRTQSELLAKGLNRLDEDAFDQLKTAGLIALIDAPHATVSAIADIPLPRLSNTVAASAQASTGATTQLNVAALNAAGFSRVRFAVLDKLLDLSLKDFSMRSWVERFEKTHNLTQLVQVVNEFIASNDGKKHATFSQELITLLKTID